ncbi:MAG: UDP-N-acetylmuramoylalanyl-D-glutamate--2,6-diaminopimelate ligase [Nitrospirae bacterium]|nr:UDP-N-acetylmuramoylalanyl-D-glutamate--2,6-diaminopimelate ligase [Nitrospirota bacterium]MBS1126547.1 UDP-N-acetylmuramoylalanyl-D-glutamate--2,6-diaminopimelate ligase [Nitrospirota bacterium]MBS1234551.1 UDP-N-acetylmuramoylalanyl-D-glutamate--2,6-diaminopimelate ligase [Nitrospirota bacterium]
MILAEIIKGINTLDISGDTGMIIAGLSYDSRKVRKGHLFFALAGEHADGHSFIGKAIENGAAAVVYEKPGVYPDDRLSPGVTLVHVKDSREALALASNNFFQRPSDSLTVIGITGTNGKTTTTYLIKSILEEWGEKVGLIGTIQYMIQDTVYAATHTTPEALEFQALLREMLDAGCRYVVTEVSSHALAQKRVDGTVFKEAVFTNLTRDHLDFHETMEAYFASKTRLFTELLDSSATSVINYDDLWGRKLIGFIRGDMYTYGLEPGPDLVATEIRDSFSGLKFSVLFRGRKYEVASSLMGLPNVYNILSAAGVALSLGVPWEVILNGIRKAEPAQGRFEKIDAGQEFLAVVDFAHTEDALERLIYTARGLSKGKIITVFGCGGDRDRGKRPTMGSLATRLSDFVIITSDNPRSEKPEDIIREIEEGAARRNYLTEPDRKEAIRRAVLMAGKDDIVLIAGKGHEAYQEIGGKRYAFSDRGVLEEAIKQLMNHK